jgi:hypothetical protein
MAQIVLMCTLSAPFGVAQAAEHCPSPRSSDLPKVLSFEMPVVGGMPGGWQGGPAAAIHQEQTLR